MAVILWSRSSLQRNSRSGFSEGSGEKPVRYCVSSLGWVPIAEEDLTPERSNKAVNKCILDLTLGRNDVNDVVGRWGEVSQITCSGCLLLTVCSLMQQPC